MGWDVRDEKPGLRETKKNSLRKQKLRLIKKMPQTLARQNCGAGGRSPVKTGRLCSGTPGQNFKGHLSSE